MQSFFQRLRWPLLAASVASLVVVATAGATHGTPDYLANGHTTPTPVGDGSPSHVPLPVHRPSANLATLLSA